MMRQATTVSLLFLSLLAFAGCQAPLRSQAIDAAKIYESPELYDREPQIQVGEKRPILDAVGWTIGIPSKLLLWNRRADNHHISFETQAAIAEYLDANELHSVRVRLNQYRPGEDWKRLVRNKSVGAPWRYSLGALSVLGETVLPGRIIGGDHYNPFTNTVHIYSDVAAIALHEAAHSKDFARRKWKGSYAFAYLIPTIPLYHESVASSDVIAYLEANGTPKQRADAARVLYPAYGTYIGSAVGGFLPKYSNPLYYGSVVAGHAAGRWEASRIEAASAHQDAAMAPNDETFSYVLEPSTQ
jgi:hypothetical protein